MRRIVYCWMAFVCRPVVLKPRLHDTTSCQTGCTTGLTTGLTTVLNEQQLFVQPVVRPGCTTGLTTGCIGLHDTAVLSNRLSNRIDNRV